MGPPEEEIRGLVADWIAKADLDFDTAVRLVAEERFRDIVAFHAQQAAEKYLKALLTRHQIEFPKTHVIRRLLILLGPVEPRIAEELDDANWLSPNTVHLNRLQVGQTIVFCRLSTSRPFVRDDRPRKAMVCPT
jgi:hypothetical protein